MRPIRITGAFTALAVVVGCTWVPLSSEAEAVRVARTTDVADCQKLGRTSSKTADRVLIFARSDERVQGELESLARNEAAEMGGDAIVPIAATTGGRQAFDVYRCGPR